MFCKKLERSYASYRMYYRTGPGHFRTAFTTIVDFERDYLGQKDVTLTSYGPFVSDKKTRTEIESSWLDDLRNRKTRIESISAGYVGPELLSAISKQQQLKKLVIRFAEFTDMSVLGNLPNLEYLEIDQCPRNLDLKTLAKCRSLKILLVFNEAQMDYEPLGRLTQLEGLEFGAGLNPGFTKRITVENFRFLESLTNLKRFRTDVKPLDSDLSPLLALRNLEEGWYWGFRGQLPSKKAIAEANPAFKKVYEVWQQQFG